MQKIDLTTIPTWILNENGVNLNYFDDAAIEKETEKALYIVASSDFGKKKFWIAKSVLDPNSEYSKREAEEVQQKIEYFKTCANKYEQLVSWAKEKGIAVRIKMKKATIIEKIAEAGLYKEIPEELK